jgi:hypothetical protein
MREGKPRLSELIAAARLIMSADPHSNAFGSGRMADARCVACKGWHSPIVRREDDVSTGPAYRKPHEPRELFHLRRSTAKGCPRFIGPYARPLGLLP